MEIFTEAEWKELERRAQKECCSSETTAHHGGGPGRPFWNAEATQFMYVPSFHFSHIPGAKSYRFRAEDEKGQCYTFDEKTPTALLSPIWKDLPEGVVRLVVYSLDQEGKEQYEVGSRTFFKLSPFRSDYPKPEYSYEEAVRRAFDFVLQQEFVLCWLRTGRPDPSYDLNVYPCKMIYSLVRVMDAYRRACPAESEKAVQIALSAADYLLSITPDASAPLPFLPPTYSTAYCPEPEKYGFDHNGNWKQAKLHENTTMLIYPARAGSAFLMAEEMSGDGKYLDAALKIGRFFEENVEENGSWKITWSEITGKPVTENDADPLREICPFLMGLYHKTGEEKWKKLADGAAFYVEKHILATYNWEGQFEDSVLSANYSNLTHFGAAALARYYAENRSDDEKCMKDAEDLMRFVEDQFVVWHLAPPWYDTEREYDTKLWHTPSVLEQYHWYTPIDSSAALTAEAFLAMYKAGRGDLYLAKAFCLLDQIVVMQEENGRIPTHWSDCDGARKDMWMNCMFASMAALSEMAEFERNIYFRRK